MAAGPRKTTAKPGRSLVHVALLRGINVGGKNMLPMAKLVEMFEEAGCEGVRTYIQSGNVVFIAKDAGKACRGVSGAIAKKFGFEGRIVVRSADELDRVAKDHPFLSAKADLKRLYVGFLADSPDPVRVAGLDPKRSPGDLFKVIGREIFMQINTGAADTRLTNAWFDSTLGTTSTFRNWRTVLKLAEMAREVE
jgi:uncharacterized protein (DUF1697 family)